MASYLQYCKAIDVCVANADVLESGKLLAEVLQLELLMPVDNGSHASYACDLLRLGQQRLNHVGRKQQGPVVIVAGCASRISEENLELAEKLFGGAFQGFDGTVLSEGVYAGVAKVLGRVFRKLKNTSSAGVELVGYLPFEEGTRDWPVEESGFDRLSHDCSPVFSIMQSIRMWKDLLESGIPIGDVILIGIGGGRLLHSSIDWHWQWVPGWEY